MVKAQEYFFFAGERVGLNGLDIVCFSFVFINREFDYEISQYPLISFQELSIFGCHQGVIWFFFFFVMGEGVKIEGKNPYKGQLNSKRTNKSHEFNKGLKRDCPLFGIR